MGIELPSPHGEAHLSPANGVEHSNAPLGSEDLRVQQSAELSTTERPAAQESRTGQGVGDATSFSAQTDVSATTPSPVSSVTTPLKISLDDVPVVAADEDLIEKQWVDSAKRIIHETQSDPYKQGEAISRLQADYLQKRYGKIVAGNE